MGLDYAAEHLLAAVRSVAVSEGQLRTRLQTAWDESVQLVWEKPCLTPELLARFKALWDRVTDETAGPRSTRLRQFERVRGRRSLRRAPRACGRNSGHGDAGST